MCSIPAAPAAIESGTFNISSCAALVVAACGVRVAKHGNRSVSSQSGSADVFEALGVRITAPPAVVERCLAEAGIGFFFAPTFHPSMRHAGPVRRELGVRTAFNLLGPLTNPAGATRQLVGVPRPEFTELLARALMLLGPKRAWVVHGADGIDEISTTGYTQDLGVPRRRGQHVLPASGGRRAAEGAAGVAEGRRRARERADHRGDPRRRARPGARRRAAERRRGAVHRRRRGVGRRRASCRRRARSIAATRSGRSSGWSSISTAEEFAAEPAHERNRPRATGAICSRRSSPRPGASSRCAQAREPLAALARARGGACRRGPGVSGGAGGDRTRST